MSGADGARFDAVVVRDTLTGKTEVVCGKCYRAGAGEWDGDVVAVTQPNRRAYKTTAGYEAALDRARTCGRCGGALMEGGTS